MLGAPNLRNGRMRGWGVSYLRLPDKSIIRTDVGREHSYVARQWVEINLRKNIPQKDAMKYIFTKGGMAGHRVDGLVSAICYRDETTFYEVQGFVLNIADKETRLVRLGVKDKSGWHEHEMGLDALLGLKKWP